MFSFFLFFSPSTACQMSTDVGSRWGQLNPSKSILSSQGRFWLATAAAWWSCGIWALATLTSCSSASRYLKLKAGSHYYYYFSSLCVHVCWLCVFVVTFLQQLESLVWERSGSLFVSSHNDGGYAVWPVTSGNACTHQPASSTIPYGEKCLHRLEGYIIY